LFEDIFPSPFVRQVESLGSGFLIDPRGYIVTNAHVVRRAQRIIVSVQDGKDYPATIISADSDHDLAVLKIHPPGDEPLPYLPLGRSDDLMVGETIIAIGNPLGYANTLTTGVISALNRTLKFSRGITYGGLIQIDAPINPGNSGGPLLNIKGELIGMNTAIRADAQNIGFAIPVDTLAEQLADLLDFERINRVVFGAKIAQRHQRDGPALYVADVADGTPAAGKLRVGDRLIRLDGRPVRRIPQFVCAMLDKKPGQQVRLAVRRGGETFEAEIPIVAKPKPDARKLADELLGMSLRPITADLARRLGLPIDHGLLVVGLDADGPAAALGIELKDILIELANFRINTLDELGSILEQVKPGQMIKIGILRGNMLYVVPIRTRSR